MAEKTLVVLVTNSSPNRQAAANQERTTIILKGHGIEPELVDGVKQKELRNELFGISGVRGNYPQFFLKETGSNKYTFLGLFDDIENLNETGSLTKEALGLTTITTTPDINDESEAADWIPLVDEESNNAKSRGVVETSDDEPMMICWGCQLPSWFPNISMKSPLVTDSTTTSTKSA